MIETVTLQVARNGEKQGVVTIELETERMSADVHFKAESGGDVRAMTQTMDIVQAALGGTVQDIRFKDDDCDPISEFRA